MENNIFLLARAQGITMSGLAERVNMAAPTLRRYARQESQPKPQLAQELADALNCSAAVVMGLQEIPAVSAKLPLYGGYETDNNKIDFRLAVDFMTRPGSLIGDADVFAVHVVGERNNPRFVQGEVLVCNPRTPLSRRRDVVVQYDDMTGEVAFLLSASPNEIMLRFYNGDEIKIDRKKVTSIATIYAIHTKFSSYLHSSVK